MTSQQLRKPHSARIDFVGQYARRALEDLDAVHIGSGQPEPVELLDSVAIEPAVCVEREIDRIEVRRKKLIEMAMDGLPPEEVKDAMIANTARREDLKAKLAAADARRRCCTPEWPTCTVRRSPHWLRL
jgi:hypothetical protein